MKPAEGASSGPKKRSRRAKRKEVDPTFKPTRGGSNSDSGSGYDSDTPAVRRQNPKRNATTTGDGSRIIYNSGRFSESGRKPTAGNRKRIRLDEPNSANSTHDGVISAGSNPLPMPPPPSPENGKPEEGGSAKTSWFFSRMLQGMKNFWAKTETTTTTTTTNDQMEYTSSSSDQVSGPSNKRLKVSKGSSSSGSRETVAYDSKDSITPDPASTKKRRLYYYNEAWHIPSEQLEIFETISSGTFGDVSRARWNGNEVAVKTLRTNGPNVGDKVLNLFLKEVSILSKLRHPSIVLFMGASITPKLTIVMEYHPKGSLYDLLHKHKEVLSYSQVVRMATEIAEGLNYLHSCSPKIIHRDVKSSNILVTATKSIKIADFGISKETTAGSDSTMTGFMGTSSYMSPEMIRGVKYTEKVDVYSFGVLLCEMYSHKIPFKSLHALQVAHRVLQGERPEIPDKCPAPLKALLKACWHEAPAERPTFREIIQVLNTL
eukprot:Phypoly_transcript_08308.p1 GENE.Phypoly_transcript_08308~~Phypoly_transcript_08308.p1  ORF type:complete len:488 (+),score=56.60 Phypoly_transcript_08308:26-1489(+)